MATYKDNALAADYCSAKSSSDVSNVAQSIVVRLFDEPYNKLELIFNGEGKRHYLVFDIKEFRRVLREVYSTIEEDDNE